MLKINKSTLLGLILFLLFFLQYFLKLEWTWLKNLQQDEMYKRWSGLGLALFITLQWLLSLSRIIKRFRKRAQTMLLVHKWAGALSPLLFYIHSIGFGYGYLLFFSYVFFSNTLLGYFNLDVVKNNSDWLFKSWMITHVALSVAVTVIMLFHIGVVFYYK